MKWLATALVVLFGLGVSSARAEDAKMCHEIYSHIAGTIIITDTGSRAPGAFRNAIRVYEMLHTWERSEELGLFHTKLCFSTKQWSEWKSKFATSGMSMCVRSAEGFPCHTFNGVNHEKFTCEAARYVYYKE